MNYKRSILVYTACCILLIVSACRLPASTPISTADSDAVDEAAGDSPPASPADTQAFPPPARILVQAPDNSLAIVDSQGKTTPLLQADRPMNSPIFQEYSSSRYARGTLYALSLGDEGVTRVFALDAGGSRLVPFIDSVSQGFAVWPGSEIALPRLAWDSASANPEDNTVRSQIRAGSIDGSDVRTLLEETGSERVLVVGRWARDGQRLLFSKEPFGLGGYILFGGASNLWSFSLVEGSAVALVQEPGMACIDDLSPDETLIAHHCANPAISIVEIATGNTTIIQPPEEGVEANFAGSARFSQDGPQVAFALARGAPDNEQGWVAVSDGLEGTARLVAAAPAGEYFQVAAWLDADTLVLQSWGVAPGVWLVDIDGRDLRRIAEGVFHGTYE